MREGLGDYMRVYLFIRPRAATYAQYVISGCDPSEKMDPRKVPPAVMDWVMRHFFVGVDFVVYADTEKAKTALKSMDQWWNLRNPSKPAGMTIRPDVKIARKQRKGMEPGYERMRIGVDVKHREVDMKSFRTSTNMYKSVKSLDSIYHTKEMTHALMPSGIEVPEWYRDIFVGGEALSASIHIKRIAHRIWRKMCEKGVKGYDFWSRHVSNFHREMKLYKSANSRKIKEISDKMKVIADSTRSADDTFQKRISELHGLNALVGGDKAIPEVIDGLYENKADVVEMIHADENMRKVHMGDPKSIEAIRKKYERVMNKQ
jgi:hypothetical protein